LPLADLRPGHPLPAESAAKKFGPLTILFLIVVAPFFLPCIAQLPFWPQ
jgi:hypothetical protein